MQTPLTGELQARELEAAIEAVLDVALAEDLGPGDVTGETVVPADARARGRLVAKADGVAAGLPAFARAFRRLDPEARVELAVADGERFARGATLARVEGRARALLAAERTALNLVQRLSGIATLAARYVEAAGGRVRVLDTRKTTPGLRTLEKYAVRCGGAENHRMGLHDQAMIKDNHVDLGGAGVGALVRALREARGPELVVTAEARDEAEALEAAAAGADVVLLDNLPPARMAALVPRLRAAAPGRVEIEASGGIDLATLEAVAASGVDRVSVGALTHSAPALDLSLELGPSA